MMRCGVHIVCNKMALSLMAWLRATGVRVTNASILLGTWCLQIKLGTGMGLARTTEGPERDWGRGGQGRRGVDRDCLGSG